MAVIVRSLNRRIKMLSAYLLIGIGFLRAIAPEKNLTFGKLCLLLKMFSLRAITIKQSVPLKFVPNTVKNTSFVMMSTRLLTVKSVIFK